MNRRSSDHENSAILEAISSIKETVEKTAGHVDEIRTKLIPDINKEIGQLTIKVDQNETDIKTIMTWKEKMTWTVAKIVGGMVFAGVAISHFLGKIGKG